MKKILFVFTLLACTALFSQQKKFNLDWNGTTLMTTDGYRVQVPVFTPKEQYSYDVDAGFKIVSQWEVSSSINENSVSVSAIKYSPISISELKGVNLKSIPDAFKFSVKNSTGRNKKYVMLNASAIVKSQTGGYNKVTAFTLQFNTASRMGGANFSANQSVSNSVLRSGAWYKFAVDKTGVFKISKNFLNQMGINTNTIDPRQIKIFGNGGQMIPYKNDINYPIDPIENAITIVGESDGVFHDSDYILFYGVGPTGIVKDTRVNTNLNPYSNLAYYYISISSGLGKRMQSLIEPVGASDVVITSFDDYKFHEVDEFNLAFVGRRWFGDKFDIETTKTFNFNFPNLVTSQPVKVKVIGVSTSANTSTMTVKLNGTDVSTMILPGVTTPNYVSEASLEEDVNSTSDAVAIQITYNKEGNPGAVGYLDYIALEATRALNFTGSQMRFKKNATAQTTGIGEYVVSNSANVKEIWEVTDANNVRTKQNFGNSNINFKSALGTVREYVAISNSGFYTPVLAANSSVQNQDIKGQIFKNSQGDFQDIDYIIVTPNANYNQAERLAQINRTRNNLNVKVVSLETIYSEFSTGNKDISAIRNLVKYVYDNASTPDKRLKYLCLFGDSSFDYKGRIAENTYYVPSWHAYSSFNLINSFVTDDFYGMMDPDEGELYISDKLDIAIGRMLADSPQRAKELVDKVESYYTKEAYGSWRNNVVVISDDVDESYESSLQETTDNIGDLISENKPFINVVKIHTDSYKQESSVGGDRYPEVTTAIANAIENGALVVNYFGHGGEDGLAKERIFEKTDAQALRNECKLNCFVTVTCEYTRFDNPLRETAGELIYWNTSGGAVSLITTTRQIFLGVGVTFNVKLEEYLFSFSDLDTYGDYEYPSMAEALRLTKSDPSISGIGQKHLVFYIGDPALKLAFPEPNVRLTKINDAPVAQNTEVLEALSYAKLAGEVTDLAGNVLTNYNGKVITTIYDKPIDRETLGNDNTTQGGQLIILNYKTLGEVIFRGLATVTNGQFEFDFIVPKDIGIPVGYGKVSFYAYRETPLSDQSGATTTNLQIGGINENAPEDNIGPVINLYLNDENFASGGITNESPTLLVKLQDENGINTASGIGHDIVATIDGDEVNPFVLNNYYVTELDDYTRGGLSFPFRDLKPGLHTLTLKAWDVYNNSSIAEIQFVVYDQDNGLVIDRVLNYPNPFVNYTEFWFNHNSSEILNISVQIFTISGKIVRTINGQTSGAGSKITTSTSRDIVWDGRDDFGDKIGKGTYVYKLKVQSTLTNDTVEKIEKLVIL
ncbi:type IX secretion system sortase PorU [Bizionia saleffrena]|uniref:Type IX secretion system sortase PorU n=1 Tax=Bizionia saleffrena TaxID=291189 RepID=A0A8H2LEG1_9FLAO|nr:type IX secretion system sortase PorU [Bizionia saleffrena]TYB74391.1 type IX secretion system sortase PorU [Bizionia saleffrena]